MTSRPLMIHAHPGHELRLFHWMERSRPVVLLLTDGSGSSAESRIAYSRRCVESAGAQCLPESGATSDRAWYDAILRRDLAPFRAIMKVALATARDYGSTLIVSDAVDGYNPMHDLCEAVGAAVAAKLTGQGSQAIHLVSEAVPGCGGEVVTRLDLDAAAIGRKREAVEAYRPLAEEARRLLERGPEMLAVESLRRPAFTWPADWSPSWEETGRARVAKARYGQAIEYARDVRPVACALLEAASGPSGASGVLS